MTAGATVATAGARDRDYLGSLFAELCRIESPSGRERACAERVISELSCLGIDVQEDGAGPRVGSDCGNLLARIPARPRQEQLSQALPEAHPSILLCAHLDTVPLQAPVEPVIVDGGWENANDGILGADNKAAVALLLALARHIGNEGAPVDVELLFTVAEEVSLAGALAFDASALRSDYGYVFDHASPIGEVVLCSPTHFRIEAHLRGAAAHAGIRPERGRSAIVAASRAVAWPSAASTRVPGGHPPSPPSSIRVPWSSSTQRAGANLRANTSIRAASSSRSRDLACGSSTTSRSTLSPAP